MVFENPFVQFQVQFPAGLLRVLGSGCCGSSSAVGIKERRMKRNGSGRRCQRLGALSCCEIWENREKPAIRGAVALLG